MKVSAFTRRKALVCTLVFALVAAAPLFAENRVIIDCPVLHPVVDGDSLGISIYYSNDVPLGGLTLGFHYNSDDIECTSVDYSNSYWMSSHNTTMPSFAPTLNLVLVGWADFTGMAPIPPQDSGLLCVLWFQVPVGTSPQCVDIDSSFVPPAGQFIFAPQAGGEITPNYYDCGPGDINIGNVPDCYPPMVSDIPDQTLAEGGSFATINLDDYVEDLSDPDQDIDWTYSGNVELTVWIDGNRVAHIDTPNEDWYDSETITFTATDPGALWDSDDAVFTMTPVNDPPVVSDIPNQTIQEGQSFTTINLDNYVNDIDNNDDEMVWTYSGNTELSVSIVNRVATISIPNPDWFGVETITFKATDPGALWDSDPATFTVINVNDPPVVSGIPDQSVMEGGSFTTINLDDYVDDIDNDDTEMNWSYSGNADLGVSIVNRVATINIPHIDWFGVETITFKATDPGGLWDSDPATFTVTNVPDDPVAPDTTVSTPEDVDLISTLPGYDVDLQPLTWAILTGGPSHGTITSFNPTTGDYTYDPDNDYYGPDQMDYSISDSKGTSDTGTVTINVTAVNDAPVVSDIPNQSIAEGGSFTTINLDDYVDDIDNDDTEMNWSYSGNTNLGVSIVNRVATIVIPHADWFGVETITFKATDPGGLFDNDAASFTVTPINDPPVARDTAVTTPEDTPMTETLPAHDVDNDPLTYIIQSGPFHGQLTSFNPLSGQFTYNPNLNYFGPDTITFKVDDGTKVESNTATVTITVTPVNDQPEVGDIPDQTIAEGGSFATFDLDDYVTDVDNDLSEIIWTYSGNNELTVAIDGENVVTIGIPNPDWFGGETIIFRATDPGDLFDSDAATFTVTPVNDPPVVGDIPDQTIPEGSSFATISLDNYVYDVDSPDEDIDWTYSGNTDLAVSIDANRVATISIPNPDWWGAETITFTATDTAGATDFDAATFTVTAVNDPPVVGDIPDQTLGSAGTFEPIYLDNYVDDVDNPDEEITWTYSGNIDLIVTIDVNRVATIETPTPDWFGVEVITFRATDPGMLYDEDNAEFNGIVCGDVNGDGLVNITDVVYLLEYIFAGGPPPVIDVAADVNCDGYVNIADVVYLIDYIFAGGPEPCADC